MFISYLGMQHVKYNNIRLLYSSYATLKKSRLRWSCLSLLIMNYRPCYETLKREFYNKNERNKKFYIFHISFKVEDTIHQKTFITVNVTISHKICKRKTKSAFFNDHFLFHLSRSSKIIESSILANLVFFVVLFIRICYYLAT